MRIRPERSRSSVSAPERLQLLQGAPIRNAERYHGLHLPRPASLDAV
jgi:hypothetical protein